MNVFISWSGAQSQKMAESLKDWLKDVIQTIDPFVSSMDIAKGDRGLGVIAKELEAATFGVVCVTRENSRAPWINFEAGALSKAIGQSRVVPCLLDLPVSDLTGPLAQFQVVSIGNKDDVFAMVRALRDHLGLTNLDDGRLARTFNRFWPDLDTSLEDARGMPVSTAATPPRNPGEILEEVLVLARRQESVLRSIVDRVDSTVPMLDIKRGAVGEPGKADVRRGAVDELIGSLDLPDELAIKYRVITGRHPVEIEVIYRSGAISAANVQHIRTQAGEFGALRRVRVTIQTEDGYEIRAVPGKETILVLPAEPVPHTADRDDDGADDGSDPFPGVPAAG